MMLVMVMIKTCQKVVASLVNVLNSRHFPFRVDFIFKGAWKGKQEITKLVTLRRNGVKFQEFGLPWNKPRWYRKCVVIFLAIGGVCFRNWLTSLESESFLLIYARRRRRMLKCGADDERVFVHNIKEAGLNDLLLVEYKIIHNNIVK